MPIFRRAYAHTLLSQAEKVKLRELIEQVERETSGEISILLLHDVEHPRQYAIEYFNHHGIGKKELHNGILILAVLDKRRIELVVGDGLHGVIPQEALDRVIHDTLAPRFRKNEFAVGLHEAVQMLGRLLRAHPPKATGPHRHLPGIVDLG